MGLYFDTTAADAVLKQNYTDEEVSTLSYQSPLWAMIEKDDSGAGRVYVGSIRSSTPSSASADAATAFGANANAPVGPSVAEQWLIPWVQDYASANISGQIIAATRDDEGAFVKAMKFEVDGAFETVGARCGAALWSNGGGAIGQVSAGSNVATVTITLANPLDAVKFQAGWVLQASATDGTSGAVRAGQIVLTAVDIVAGTLTAALAWNNAGNIPAIAVNDFLFMYGDFGKRVQGVPAWIPFTTPTATPYNGVNRAIDPVRLGGWRFNGKGGPKGRTLARLSAQINAIGGKPDKAFLNPSDWADVVEDLGTRVQYMTVPSFDNPQIAFEAVKLATSRGMMAIVEDAFVPQGFGWELEMKTWKFVSMGKAPRILGPGADDIEWLRAAGADAYQLRIGYYACTYLTTPGRNGVCKF